MDEAAKKLLGEKIEQLKHFNGKDVIAINARDLRSFGMPVEDRIPAGNPVFLTVGDLRAVAANASVGPIVEDCGCPERE